MVDIAAFLFVIVTFVVMVVAMTISEIKDNPRGYRKVVKAIAEFVSFPVLLTLNIKHNIRAHRKRLKQIDTLSETSDLDVAFRDLVREVTKSRETTEAIESLRTKGELEDYNKPEAPVSITRQRQSQ